MTSDAIRVFIGTEPQQRIATAVLKHSIASRTHARLEFHDLSALGAGVEQLFYTGFSFYRWAIPSVCGYAGRAIYLDTDIVVMCDIEKLWTMDMGPHAFLARARDPTCPEEGAYTSVMLMDCGRCREWDFQRLCANASQDAYFYKAVMWCFDPSPLRHSRGDLPPEFNALDDYEDSATQILHYTDVTRQPWRYKGHPYEQVFRDAFMAAFEANAIARETVEEDIRLGYVHQELIQWCLR